MTTSLLSGLPERLLAIDRLSSRLDIAVAARGLLPSRSKARAAIASGHVTVNGSVAKRPGTQVTNSDLLVIAAAPRYVGRGGEKLEAALAEFQINVANRQCLDVGASTGGFTDCLLQNGAAHVTALDVGSGQISLSIARDSRVDVRENINVRNLDDTDIVGPFDVITVDISFISLTLVFAPLLNVLAPEGDLIALIKPQFEVGRENLGNGGVVKSAAMRDGAIMKVTASAEVCGLRRLGLIESPIAGGDGNIEFLAHCRRTYSLDP